MMYSATEVHQIVKDVTAKVTASTIIPFSERVAVSTAMSALLAELEAKGK